MTQHQRLSLADWHERYKQQAQWSQNVRQYLFEQITTGPGDKILEVGSGTGAVSDLLSNETGGQVYGIDIDFPSLLFSKKAYAQLNLSAADGFHLPFADKVFRITYCHYLLLWVQNPLAILKEMARVTQPGGYVVALSEPDYKARIDYPKPLDKLGQQQTQALKDQGVDTQIGRKLGRLFRQAGLREITVGILGARWNMSQSHAINEKEWMMIRSDLSDDLTPEILECYRMSEIKAGELGERVLFIPTFYASGVVR